MKNRLLIWTAIAASTLAMPAPVHADVFTYKMYGGVVLTIDNESGQGRLRGAYTGQGVIDARFASPDFRGFTGGAVPSGTYDLSSLSGTRMLGGQTYRPNASHQQRLIFGKRGQVNLWSHWGKGTQLGDYFTYIERYQPPAPSVPGGGSTSTGGSTSSTSTGGSTSSSSTGGSSGGDSSGASGTSSGGADIVAPGMLALFGLAGGAVAIRRRRNSKSRKD